MVSTLLDGPSICPNEARIAPRTGRMRHVRPLAARVLRAVWSAFVDGAALHGAAICGWADHPARDGEADESHRLRSYTMEK